MKQQVITAVGIDVSKGKSMVAVRRPGGEVVCGACLAVSLNGEWYFNLFYFVFFILPHHLARGMSLLWTMGVGHNL